MIADEIYQDVPYDGPVAPIGSLDHDAPIISLSGLSKGYLVPGWRTGWMAVGGGDRLKDVLTGITRLAEGRLCSTMPMQRAIAAALTGDRSHQPAFRAALRERAELVFTARERHAAHVVHDAEGRVLRDAEDRAAARARPTSST